MQKIKFKILLCALGDELEGGIPAVVYGIKKIFEHKADVIDYRRIIYAKPYCNIGTIKRLIREIYQLMNFIFHILIYKPDIIHIQSSFDKKTIIRDSIHLWLTILLKKKLFSTHMVEFGILFLLGANCGYGIQKIF